MEPISITIIVPNYNGAEYLHECLESLQNQDYPKLEVFVVDGGSCDNSVRIIQKYEASGLVDWWCSEPDRGQSHALNKGFSRANGEVVNWLCSDDFLESGAFHQVNEFFQKNPDTDVLCGACRVFRDPNKEEAGIWKPKLEDLDLLRTGRCVVNQQACFYRKNLLYSRAKPIDETLHYAMDLDLWNHFLKIGAVFHSTDHVLAWHRHTTTNKTSVSGAAFIQETYRVIRRYDAHRLNMGLLHRWLIYPLMRIRKACGSKACYRITAPLWRVAETIILHFYTKRQLEGLSAVVAYFMDAEGAAKDTDGHGIKSSL